MIACGVVANSRPEYLARVLRALAAFHPDIPVVVYNDDAHLGMAKNVQKAWDGFLDTDADFLLHMEDDMELCARMPLDDAIVALRADSSLAQMCFRREPWWGSPDEMRHGDQLAAICELAEVYGTTEKYTTHNWIFSLNPCLIPRDVVELGWPEGPLGVGNEAGMTTKLRVMGFQFGSWGHPGDGNVWARHIGETRGDGWAL